MEYFTKHVRGGVVTWLFSKKLKRTKVNNNLMYFHILKCASGIAVQNVSKKITLLLKTDLTYEIVWNVILIIKKYQFYKMLA